MDYHVSRRANLLRDSKSDGVDGLLVTHPVNVRYLTGFTGSSGVLLLSAKHAILVSDSRYEEQIKEENPTGLVWQGDNPVRNAGFPAGTIGFGRGARYSLRRQECRRCDNSPRKRYSGVVRRPVKRASKSLLHRALHHDIVMGHRHQSIPFLGEPIEDHVHVE